jgi:hypothetical protein
MPRRFYLVFLRALLGGSRIILNKAGQILAWHRLGPRLSEWVIVKAPPFVVGVVLGFWGSVQVLPWAAADMHPDHDAIEITGLPTPDWAMLLQASLRQDVEMALSRMNDADLATAYGDIDAAFRQFLDTSHLGAARTLVDYAFLAERTLAMRGLRRPEGAPSASDMLRRFEEVF